MAVQKCDKEFVTFIIPGSNHLYVFLHPKNPKCDSELPATIDWDFAQKEIAQAKGFATGGGAGLTRGNITFLFYRDCISIVFS